MKNGWRGNRRKKRTNWKIMNATCSWCRKKLRGARRKLRPLAGRNVRGDGHVHVGWFWGGVDGAGLPQACVAATHSTRMRGKRVRRTAARFCADVEPTLAAAAWHCLAATIEVIVKADVLPVDAGSLPDEGSGDA